MPSSLLSYQKTGDKGFLDSSNVLLLTMLSSSLPVERDLARGSGAGTRHRLSLNEVGQ